MSNALNSKPKPNEIPGEKTSTPLWTTVAFVGIGLQVAAVPAGVVGILYGVGVLSENGLM